MVHVPVLYVTVGLIVLIIVNWFVSPLSSYSVARLAFVRSMVYQATAWYGFATSLESDSSSAHRLVYVSRAVAYVSAARSTMPDVDIERATGVDVSALVDGLHATERTYLSLVGGSNESVVGWLDLSRSI